MSISNSSTNFNGQSAEKLAPLNVDRVSRQELSTFDFSVHLEQLALFLAQTWKDAHPDATADSEADVNDCIMAVTAEMAIAAKAVGGPAGLAILTGGGSAAARAVYRQVLSGSRN